MSYITDYQEKFDDLKFQIENQGQLKRQANGGNSILFTFLPLDEHLFISKAKELYVESAGFIDVAKLFVEFIEKDGLEPFKEYYNDLKLTSYKVFRSDDPSSDLFDMIINEIKKTCDEGKIPFLIRTGCLYGTGIDNVNIMENKVVMSLPHPLVIFYPSRIDGENIYFLNFKLASKYRCILI